MFNSFRFADALLKNGALLIIPPLLISFTLWGRLPEVYHPDYFWQDIPSWLRWSENILRLLVFILPAMVSFAGNTLKQKWGWFLYAFGLALYVASYLLLIYPSENKWSASILGFTAPAWTTLIWFIGIGLLCARRSLFSHWWQSSYFLIVLMFVLLHTAHTLLIYVRLT